METHDVLRNLGGLLSLFELKHPKLGSHKRIFLLGLYPPAREVTGLHSYSGIYQLAL